MGNFTPCTIYPGVSLTAADAEALRSKLLQVVLTHEAQLGFKDEFGQRYLVDFWLDWHGRQARVRSSWIIEQGSVIPRLTSCYVL